MHSTQVLNQISKQSCRMLLVLAEFKAAITSNAHTLPELMHRCLGTVDVDVAGYNELQGI